MSVRNGGSLRGYPAKGLKSVAFVAGVGALVLTATSASAVDKVSRMSFKQLLKAAVIKVVLPRLHSKDRNFIRQVEEHGKLVETETRRKFTSAPEKDIK